VPACLIRGVIGSFLYPRRLVGRGRQTVEWAPPNHERRVFTPAILFILGMHLTQVAPRSCGCRRTEARNSVQGPRRSCVWEACGGRLGRR
jgi:hypothetical protein